MLLLAQYFDWGGVASGYALSFYGLAQAIAQYFYAIRRRASDEDDVPAGMTPSGPRIRMDVEDLRIFEIAEVASVLAMFSKSDATHSWRIFFNVLFVVASIIFYLSSCLTSAPLNDLLLVRAARAKVGDDTSLLLAMQYGIFLAFFAAPIAARGSLVLGGVNTNAIAGLLICGWALQTLANGCLVGRVETGRVVLVASLLTAAVTWLMLDHGVGGTGILNIFSWHPIAMMVAFFLFMTPGQLVYRRDSGFLVEIILGCETIDVGKKDIQRYAHGKFMAIAGLFGAGGYVAIFLAHFISGESEIGLGTTSSRTAHVVLGYLTLLWLLVQTITGVVKAIVQPSSPPKDPPQDHPRGLFTWHGSSGKYLLLFAYITSTLGFWLRMNYTKHEHWAFAAKLALTGGAALLFGWRLFPPSMFPPNGVDTDFLRPFP